MYVGIGRVCLGFGWGLSSGLGSGLFLGHSS